MKGNKIDIKSLTSELKSRSRDSGAAGTRPKADAEKQSEIDMTGKQENPAFLELINEVNKQKHYQMDRFIYVDADIHEVFNKLKTHTKLKLSYLASYLLEQFIIEHQESIKAIISKKQNKFLD